VRSGSYLCELAVVGDQVGEHVLITTAADRIVGVEINADTAAAAGAHTLHGVTIAGMANAHSHAFHRALRSRTQRDKGSFWTWRNTMYTAAQRLNPDNYFRLARATFAEMALAGIVAVGEFHYVHHQPSGSPYADMNAMGEALLAAANDAGIRITLLDTLYLHGGLGPDGHLAPEGAQRRYSDRSVDAWAARVQQLHPTESARIGAAIHSVRAVDSESLRAASAVAIEQGWALHAHVSEQRAENEASIAHYGRSPVEHLAECDVLGQHFCAVHATHLSPHDVSLLASSRSSVCMCPTTERDLGDGIGRTDELTANGISLSLGSDSHAVIDIFEEARAVELNERLRSEQRGTHSAASLLNMATKHGHECLGWSDAGTIAVGERADLVTVSLSSTRTAGVGVETAREATIFAATAADVTSVMVDGKFVVAGGAHANIDVERELDSSIRELLDS
jgi:formiminoglutamate deiminase